MDGCTTDVTFGSLVVCVAVVAVAVFSTSWDVGEVSTMSWDFLTTVCSDAIIAISTAGCSWDRRDLQR